jgi:WD40 repeat protein
LEIRQVLTPLPLGNVSPAFSWPNGVISSIAFSPDGKDIALGCGDGSIVLCSSRSRDIRDVFKGHSERVWSVAYAPDGKTLASASGRWDTGGESEVKLWDVASGRERATLLQDDRAVFAVAFSPDGKILASGGRDQTIRLWDVATGRIRGTCAGHQGPVRSIAFHPLGRAFVSAGLDGSIRFWDAGTGLENHEPIVSKGYPPNCVVIAPDGETFVANTSQDPTLHDRREEEETNFDPTSSEIQVAKWRSREKGIRLGRCRYGILGLAVSPDGKTVATGGGLPSDEGEVKLWDLATGNLKADLKGHGAWVECVAFSPDGKTLVSAGGYWEGPGEIKLWDLRTLPGTLAAPKE